MPERGAVEARVASFRYAFRGVAAVFRTEPNAWIHACATIAVLIAGFGFGITRGEWLAVVLAIGSVWTAESLNTAFEALCNVASPRFHPEVERAKDIAAAAVLLASIAAAVVGVLVFVPRLVALFA